MKILIVWEEIPDETSFIVIDEANKETTDKLSRFHNHFINASNTPDELQDEMNAYFYDDSLSTFKYTKIKHSLVNQTFDLVIITGFML